MAPRLEGKGLRVLLVGLSRRIRGYSHMVSNTVAPDTPAVLEPGLLSAYTPVAISHEDERFSVYDDSLGIPTVGVGLALMYKDAKGVLHQSPYAMTLCNRHGVDYQAVLHAQKSITREQSRAILNACIIDTIEWLVILFPAFWSYSQPRQIGILDMGFEMGEAKFRGFHQTISCILSGNWAGAAANALHSKWASEVPARAAFDAGLLKGNTNDSTAR